MWSRITGMSMSRSKSRSGQADECMHENRFCYEGVHRAGEWMIRSCYSCMF
jgi:hypothetical protein